MDEPQTSTLKQEKPTTMQSTRPTISRDDVADFVQLEAELADTRRFEEWLALWNPQRASYVVPYPGGTGDGLWVAIVRDDFEHLLERIQHLNSSTAHAPDPPSRLCRVIGRVRVCDGEEGSLVASSNFICVESRPDREVLWAGTTVHTIAPLEDGDSFELWQKEVHLVNAESEIPAIAFLI